MEKRSDKIQYPLMMFKKKEKTFRKVGASSRKSAANIILHSE